MSPPSERQNYDLCFQEVQVEINSWDFYDFLSNFCVSPNKNTLKLRFSKSQGQKINEAKKLLSLLFLLKRESEKTLSSVLALAELIYLDFLTHKEEIRPYLRSIIETEIQLANEKKSAFEVVWLVFFSRYLSLGISDFKTMITDPELIANSFVKCFLTPQHKIYPETKISLFRKPSECKGTLLVDQFDVFQRKASI
ncbi:hypothetical protein [Azohydromonas australica]|uniref:hypothetical protein n=1 Tax=Azohydromonas australica TaxID=364039 RepID=UPI0012EC162C|nr:hypothetical protein [Azohydromonas australica]